MCFLDPAFLVIIIINKLTTTRQEVARVLQHYYKGRHPSCFSVFGCSVLSSPSPSLLASYRTCTTGNQTMSCPSYPVGLLPTLQLQPQVPLATNINTELYSLPRPRPFYSPATGISWQLNTELYDSLPRPSYSHVSSYRYLWALAIRNRTVLPILPYTTPAPSTLQLQVLLGN